MNRRGFFARTFGALAAAVVAPFVPRGVTAGRLVVFRGRYLIVDPRLPAMWLCADVSHADADHFQGVRA